mmetsp:Transcript_40259/g.78711  ORF Transcript_40259/g.78711 Transcript_40259/m.78711 type:complete len:202 (+) Transcript_40259:433-1038(+)
MSSACPSSFLLSTETDRPSLLCTVWRWGATRASPSGSGTAPPRAMLDSNRRRRIPRRRRNTRNGSSQIWPTPRRRYIFVGGNLGATRHMSCRWQPSSRTACRRTRYIPGRPGRGISRSAPRTWCPPGWGGHQLPAGSEQGSVPPREPRNTHAPPRDPPWLRPVPSSGRWARSCRGSHGTAPPAACRTQRAPWENIRCTRRD